MHTHLFCLKKKNKKQSITQLISVTWKQSFEIFLNSFLSDLISFDKEMTNTSIAFKKVWLLLFKIKNFFPLLLLLKEMDPFHHTSFIFYQIPLTKTISA